MKRTQIAVAVAALPMLLAACTGETARLENGAIPMAAALERGRAAAYLVETDDAELLRFFKATEGRTLYAKTAVHDEEEQWVELVSHVEENNVLLERELAVLGFVGDNWEVVSRDREILPEREPLSELTAAYREQTPQTMESLDGEWERLLLQFATNYAIVCGGLNFTTPDAVSDEDKYLFFRFIQYEVAGMRGEKDLSARLYDEEEGAFVVPVALIREYLDSYLGTSLFDPAQACPEEYRLEQDAIVTRELTDFGGGCASGLLAVEKADGVVICHVGLYDIDKAFAETPDYVLQEWVELRLRPNPDDVTDFTLLSRVTTRLNEDGTQSVIEDSSHFGTPAWQAERAAKDDEQAFERMRDDPESNHLDAVCRDGVLSNTDRFRKYVENAANGQADSARIYRMDADGMERYLCETDSGGQHTLTHTVRRGERWYEVEYWRMEVPRQITEGYILRAADGSMELTFKTAA